MTLERYMARRRFWEWVIWVSYLMIAFVANTGIVWLDLDRSGVPFYSWEPPVWEATSGIIQGLLIFVILRFDRRYPIRADSWRTALLAHASFTIVFSLIHVTTMYWMRVGLYELIGNNNGYWWPNWWSEFGYEYLKDFRSYFFFVGIIYLYRFVLRRMQGEAEFLSENHDDAEPVAVTDRFLIKKLGREFLVRVEHIDWIESAGNYVNLHVGASIYPLRETMIRISDRLSPQGFLRVHRSVIVNLDRIAEIETFDTGDGKLRLTSDITVPISRHYRKQLKEKLRQ